MSDSIRERINTQLKLAQKARDRRRISTLRLINAAIKDREIAARGDGNSDGVGEPEVLAILAKMVAQREESVKTYEEAGRLELAQQEQEEKDIISEFLPRQLSDEEVRVACDQMVEELGCEGLKDMGRTMSALKQRHAGQMDFGKASAIIKEKLN